MLLIHSILDALPPAFNSNKQRPFLPTDQEIGIKPETVISDPNFNTGSHPGEIYVDGKEKASTNGKTSGNRYYNQQSKYYHELPKYYHSSYLHDLVNKYF